MKQFYLEKLLPSSITLRTLLRRGTLLYGALLFTNTNVSAEGSKDLYPAGAQSLRSYLNSRPITTSSAAFDPYPNPGVLRVYVKNGETIYTGSSVVGKAYDNGAKGEIVLISPTGRVVRMTSAQLSTASMLS